jgi:Zn-dependent peptidase ImmA (M78 family)
MMMQNGVKIMLTMQNDGNYSHLYELTKQLDNITYDLIREHLGEILQPPIDIETIINKMAICIKREVMEDSNKSGAIIVTQDGACTIYVNASNHPLRQRFTMAHELGHYISYHSRDKTNCSRIDYIDNRFEVYEDDDISSNTSFKAARNKYSENGTDPEEVFANKFAATILMPKIMVAEYKNRFNTSSQLANQFQVSKIAMDIRLINL